MKLLLIAALVILPGRLASAKVENMPSGDDPNANPKHERLERGGRPIGEILLDDTRCPKGERAYLKLRCGDAEVPLRCERRRSIVECRAKPPAMNCKPPQVLVPVLKCGE